MVLVLIQLPLGNEGPETSAFALFSAASSLLSERRFRVGRAGLSTAAGRRSRKRGRFTTIWETPASNSGSWVKPFILGGGSPEADKRPGGQGESGSGQSPGCRSDRSTCQIRRFFVPGQCDSRPDDSAVQLGNSGSVRRGQCSSGNSLLTRSSSNQLSVPGRQPGDRIASPLFGCSLGWRIYEANNLQQGIIVEQKVDIRSGPGAQNVTVFTVHEGTKVRIRGDAPGWYQVSLANGWVGWLGEKLRPNPLTSSAVL